MTTVISSIDSSGSGDFTTMAAWEAATDIDLVAKAITDGSPALEIAEIVEDDTITDAAGLLMLGATTDVNSHRIIRSAGVKYDVITGVGPTLRMTTGGNHQILNWTTEPWNEFDGFRLLRDITAADDGFHIQARADGLLFSNLTLMRTTASGANDANPALRFRSVTQTAETFAKAWNIVVIGNGANTGIQIGIDQEGGTELFNCSVYNVFNDGIQIGWGGGAFGGCENCISMSNGTDFVYVTGDTDYCLSSDATVTGTNSHASETLANIWLDAANDDLTLISGSNAHNGGNAQAAQFVDDIRGFSRPYEASWDMGAYELLALPNTFLKRMEHMPAPNPSLRM